jgi:thiamine pyrophosphokinase
MKEQKGEVLLSFGFEGRRGDHVLANIMLLRSQKKGPVRTTDSSRFSAMPINHHAPKVDLDQCFSTRLENRRERSSI